MTRADLAEVARIIASAIILLAALWAFCVLMIVTVG